MYPELVTRSDLEVFLPPIGGQTVYIFGNPRDLANPGVELTARVHDECNGSDVFGSDICTCRPYLTHAIEECIRGAQEGGGFSVGFNVELPHEQDANSFLDLGVSFRHFYARKVMLVKAAEGFVLFPGGFGTLDELFESLTLIQTDKVREFPVSLIGTDYWSGLLEWITARPLAERKISPEDVNLLHATDDVHRAVQAIYDHWTRRRSEPPVHDAEKADAQ